MRAVYLCMYRGMLMFVCVKVYVHFACLDKTTYEHTSQIAIAKWYLMTD